MKRKTERERFEAWATRAGYMLGHAYNNGRLLQIYYVPITQHAWKGWQAAKRAAARRASKAPKERRVKR